jgi:Ser/Thr protein kinase RdoA (MazF antagonist)
MDDGVIVKVLRAYGMRPVRLLAVQKGYRNESHAALLADGRRVNLILYKSEPDIVSRIKRANAVADYLASQGLPARSRVDPRIIRLNGTRYAAVYYYLPGSTIPWEAYTKAHIKLLGQTMALMHGILAGMPYPPADHSIADEYLTVVRRMERYFTNPQTAAAVTAKLGVHVDTGMFQKLATVLTVCKQLPGQQALHMDFVRGNVLFQHICGKPLVSGMLDFEKTGSGHPLFDIARTLAFLLVDCKYKKEDKVRKYFLLSGYAKQRGRLFKNITIYDRLKDDISLLERLLDLFLLYDFYKFLKHNPYESLDQNEHFVRTKQILINRNIISVPEMLK